MRSYTGIFSDYAYINEDTLSLRSGLSRQQIYETLVLLTKQHILHYIPGKKTPYIIYTCERRETSRIHLSKEVYEDRKESFERRIKAMLEYAETDNHCRSRMLLKYFGEKNEHNCGQCDVCLKKHQSGLKQGDFDEIAHTIRTTLENAPKSSRHLMNELNYDKEKISCVLRYLIAEEVVQEENGILTLKAD